MVNTKGTKENEKAITLVYNGRLLGFFDYFGDYKQSDGSVCVEFTPKKGMYDLIDKFLQSPVTMNDLMNPSLVMNGERIYDVKLNCITLDVVSINVSEEEFEKVRKFRPDITPQQKIMLGLYDGCDDDDD